MGTRGSGRANGTSSEMAAYSMMPLMSVPASWWANGELVSWCRADWCCYVSTLGLREGVRAMVKTGRSTVSELSTLRNGAREMRKPYPGGSRAALTELLQSSDNVDGVGLGAACELRSLVRQLPHLRHVAEEHLGERIPCRVLQAVTPARLSLSTLVSAVRDRRAGEWWRRDRRERVGEVAAVSGLGQASRCVGCSEWVHAPARRRSTRGARRWDPRISAPR
jgi:hypothetical protein